MKIEQSKSFALFKKVLWDFRWTALLYSVVMTLYAVMMVGFYPSIKENAEQFRELLSSYPDALIEAFGITSASFESLEGFISVEYLSLVWVLIISIFTFSLGSAVVAGEKDKGTSEFLFALPWERYKFVFSKFLGSFFITTLVVEVSLLSIAVPSLFIEENINKQGFSVFLILGLALSFFLLAFSTFVSSLFSSKAKVYGTLAGFFVLSYLLHIVHGITDALDSVYFLSFFKYYGNPTEILTKGVLSGQNLLVLFILGLVFLAVSMLIAEKRDF